jgi:hypothetical protein
MSTKQHSDAISLFRVFRALEAPLEGYNVAAASIGLSGNHSRHVGQVCSRIDYACFIAGLPMLSVNLVRKNDGSVNEASFAKLCWHSTKDEVVNTSIAHEWTDHQFDSAFRFLIDLPQDCARVLWNEAEEWSQEKIRYQLHRNVCQLGGGLPTR